MPPDDRHDVAVEHGFPDDDHLSLPRISSEPPNNSKVSEGTGLAFEHRIMPPPIMEFARTVRSRGMLPSLSETPSELDHVGGSGNLMRNDRLPETADALPGLIAQVEETA